MRIEQPAWRINRIKRLSEFGTSLDSASATATNRDQLVIPFSRRRFRQAPFQPRMVAPTPSTGQITCQLDPTIDMLATLCKSRRR
jgi:hypothetical protein